MIFCKNVLCVKINFKIFLKCISARNLKNTFKLSKNTIGRSKPTISNENVLLKQGCVFFEFFPLFKGPGRAHMGPYGPIWTLMGPYWPDFV